MTHELVSNQSVEKLAQVIDMVQHFFFFFAFYISAVGHMKEIYITIVHFSFQKFKD